MARYDAQTTDEALGSLVRLHRKSAGYSQEELGRLVGTSAQQIQKYEVGQNRISVHRYLSICAALGIDAVSTLEELVRFQGFETTKPGASSQSSNEVPERQRELDFLASSSGRILVDSLARIGDPDLNSAFAQFARIALKKHQS